MKEQYYTLTYLIAILIFTGFAFHVGQTYGRNQVNDDCLWQCFRTENKTECPTCGWVCED